MRGVRERASAPEGDGSEPVPLSRQVGQVVGDPGAGLDPAPAGRRPLSRSTREALAAYGFLSL